MTGDRPWRAAPGGLALAVRLTPKGGADRIDGVGADAAGRPLLLARVSAPPEAGAANAALLRLIAKTAGLPASAARLEAGAAARVKRLTLAGDAEALAASLEASLEAIRRKAPPARRS